MRILTALVPALCALSAVGGDTLFAQGVSPGLTIGNYQLVSETRLTRSESWLTYKADLTNTGVARNALTATLTSKVPSIQVMAGQGTLRFPAVPANGTVTSTNTFTILVDRSVPFDFANLQWTFVNPIANAGPNRTAAIGSTVTLNGSGSSNPSGIGTLTYNWAFVSRPAGSTAQLSNSTAIMPAFVVDVGGAYVIRLTVSNGVAEDSATVTVSTSNSAPVANAGPNQSVTVNATVTLNGTASSDVDGDPLTYAWTLISRPAGSAAALVSPTSVSPTFVADRAGTYVAQLIVNDGKVNSAADTVSITTQNTRPVANAGPNQTVSIGAVVQLNGAGSTDVDRDPLTYQWSLITRPAGSTATLSSLTSVNPTFTADRPGTYVAQLIVDDGSLDSLPATVTVSTNAAQAPTANAGTGQTVKHGALVTLSGSGTDPQSLPLTFKWSLSTKPAGSAAVLSSASVANPSFTADFPGTYVAQLIVNNGFLDSAPKTVTITTTNTVPVARAGADQSVNVGALVTLNGSTSSDADLDALTYAWSMTSRPAGSNAALSAANSPTPTFVADVRGIYVVQLIVNDRFANSLPDTVAITAGQGSISASAGTPQSAQVGTAFANRLQATVRDAGNNAVSGVTVTFTTPPATGPSGSFAGAVNTAVTDASGVATSAPFTANNVAGAYTVAASTPGITGAASFTLTNTVGPAASIAATGGTPQTADVGTAFAGRLLATVRDSFSNPVPNATVTFTVVPAGGASGTFAGGVNTAVTNASGVATSALFTANNVPGSYTVRASVAGVATPATFALTNDTGPVTSITATGGTPQTADVGTAFASTLRATVRDNAGNGVPGITVTFTAVPVAGASATFAGGVNTAVTNASGVATSAVLTANNVVGSYTVRASVTGVATPAIFSLTNDVGPPAAITATGGTPQTADVGTAFTSRLLATVRDSGGNPVPGVTVTYTVVPVAGAGGTFAGGANTAVTNASGVATSAVFTANNSIGAYTVRAAVTGVATPATFSLTNDVGPPASITATAGTPQTADIGTAFAARLQATVRDSGGNPVPGVTVTYTVVPVAGAGGTFAGGANTAVTIGSGVATSAVFTANNTVGAYTVRASVTGVATPATFSLTNDEGPPASITATAGTPQTADIATAFATRLQATVRDAGGNPVGGVTVTFTAPTTGASGAFAGGVNTAVTNDAGVATAAIFTANNVVGTYNVQARVTGVATAAAFALTNDVGPPASITASGGTPQTADVATAFGSRLLATVRDSGGNAVPGVTVTYTVVPVAGASGTFAGGVNTAVTNASGVATSAVFTANNTIGSYTVRASVTGVATPATFSLTNDVGPPATVAATGGTPQSVQVATAFPTRLTATVRDVGGNPVPGVTVTYTVVPAGGAGGSFTGGVTTALTNASGVATSAVFNANNVAGSYTVRASVSGVATPASFALTNNAGPPAAITATSGMGQSTIVGSAFAQRLVATVRDAHANPVTGATVTFTVPGFGPSAVFAGGANTAVTNTAGQATSAVVSANNAIGTYNVAASVGGVAAAANFALTNTSIPIAALTIADGVVGQNLQVALSVTISEPAPLGGLNLVVTSANPSLVTVAGRPVDTGVASVTIPIGEGLKTATVFAHGLASSGSAQLTASAAGYPSDTATVTLAPSGFVLYGPNGVGVQSFVVPQGTTNFELTVSPARLTSALAFAAIQPIRGGLTVMVPVDSSPTTVGTVAPSQVSFGGGTSIANLFFNAIASGAAAVTAGIPAGFMQPASNANRMNATVTPSGLVANSLSIGKDLEVPTNIRLNSPAGSSGAVVTVTSSDATKVRFSTSPTTAGTGSLTLNVEAGRNSTAIFYVQALANTGAVAYSATASGFGSANATVNLFPSGFVLQGPFGVGSNFITTTGAANSDLTVIGGRLDASLNFVEPQQIRGGLNAAVSVTSSNTAAGTITIPTVSIPAGATSGETQFDPIGQGLSTLRAVAPAGFSTPAANSALTADVRTPALNITGGLLIGKNLQEVGSILLGQPAPPSGVVVQLTSNSGLLRLSNSPNTAGTASINVTIPGGQSSATYIIQSLGDTGTATYTATAPGYQTSTATINLSRSGIVISGLFGFGFPLIAPLNGGPQPVTVSTALLDSGNAFIATQPLAGGQTVSVSITNSNPGIGTVSSPVTITGGSDGNTGTFTPLAVGETVLGAVTPAGYTTPSNNRTVTARVTP